MKTWKTQKLFFQKCIFVIIITSTATTVPPPLSIILHSCFWSYSCWLPSWGLLTWQWRRKDPTLGMRCSGFCGLLSGDLGLLLWLGKQIRWGGGVPGEKELAIAFWHKSHLWYKPGQVLDLEQISVIMFLKKQNKLFSGKRNSNSKDNKSVVKTPSSVSVVKIGLKYFLELFYRL